MYIPRQFSITDEAEIHAFIDNNGFGQLLSMVGGRLFSSHLPFLLSDCKTRLFCHLAKQNPQVSEIAGQEVLVTLQGSHDYVSPSWYETPGVPTWNYQAVHLYGNCRLISASKELAALLDKLTMKYEAALTPPWQPDYRATLLDAIVGLEIDITEVQCKYKLSQNRSESDQIHVSRQLEATGSKMLAAAMQQQLEQLQGSK
ncbi:MAG TPA: transcriptional regulator [Spongiibacteraceae bacterium]|nr:transcriptional regulator [Spongiibacteraceae bacterium]MBN51918.1 transcriptional regulator [Spongiibacteraceae bacterium]HCS28820.1 transcriptional regulator [Spongiibacteraceae bacterium]|tara:strand:- start:108 stop:710 length:603 start_codon:yes stop_codon:yes gene_type:complete